MKILVGLVGCFIFAGGKACYAQTSWENLPYNWNNNQYNYQNSSANYRNSTDNYKNSQYNYYENNSIYDNDGTRQGYAVANPSGVVNFYDNNGNRQGYFPNPYGQ